MEIVISPDRNVVLTFTLERRIQKELRDAFAIHEQSIQGVRVSLSCFSDRNGEMLKRCRVEVLLRPRGTLVVEETDRRSLVAVARAARLIENAVQRRLVSDHSVKIVSNVLNREDDRNQFYVD